MAVVLQGLGPDSAACISRYRNLCAKQDFGAVKGFLNDLIRQDQEKFLLLIITSKAARIQDKTLEYDIFEYLYGSRQLPLYLRIYANTRCCYKVSNAPDAERAERYLSRGYAALLHRQACGASENSKRDRLHIGFSAMLAMLHVQLTHRRWSDAHALAQGAVGEVGRFPEGGALTGSYYGTNTRIARIIGINYALDLALDHNLEGATHYAALLRQSFSLAMAKADLNLVRFSEFCAGLPLYRVIAESQARLKEPGETINELVNLSVIIKTKGRKKVARLLAQKLSR